MMEKSKMTRAEQDFDRGRMVMTPAIVFSADGAKLGKVIEVADEYVLVQKGFFFPKEFFIPTWAIDREDPHRIDLHLSKVAAHALGREDLPRAGDAWYEADMTSEPPSAKGSIAASMRTS